MSEILTPEQINLYRHAAKLDPPFAPAHRLLDALDAIEALRAKLTEVERERDAALSGSYYDQRMPLFMTQLAAARGRAEHAEADRDRLMLRLDHVDCTAREGGDVRHCRIESPCLRCDRDRLAAELGERRMCVNCGRTKPASEDRHEPLPECTGLDGHAACTFDMTPQEAWEHWRAEAHRLRELYSDLIYEVATKHPGESRHQTAKRYIHERENPAVHQARAALAEAPAREEGQ